jgi:polysaccharide deacetylase family protein (PEP-CTERM system associated)
MKHILSFDVEEYFQVQAAAEGGVRVEDWSNYACRLAEPIDRILSLLAEHETKATFFVLGWVAANEPEIVQQIAAAGHEVASHGMNHRMLGEMTPEEFRTDLVDSRKRLEDLSGRSIIGYRAPTFSITRETAWALDVLADEGFRYDSSIFPIRHDRYGIPGAPRWMHRAVGPGGGEVIELPPLTSKWLGMNLPVGGGGYLRLLPRGMVRRAIARADRAGQRAMIYLHPWEFDSGQPVLPMSRASRFRHRVNLSRTESKLRGLLGRFEFTSAEAVIQPEGELPREDYGGR